MNIIYKLKGKISTKKNWLFLLIAIIIGEFHDFILRIQDFFWIIKKFLGLVKFETRDGKKTYGDKLCIFALYQKGRIERNVFHQLEEITRQGFSLHVVSNLEIQPDDLSRLETLCVKITIRDNIARDFGAYKDGVLYELERMKKEHYVKSMLLMNDSIYFPTHDPSAIFKKMEMQEIDFWGLTENFEESFHIQSFFIVFNKEVICSLAFLNYWRSYAYNSTRVYAIQKGEVGLTKSMIAAGFRSLVAYPSEELYKHIIDAENKDLAQILSWLPSYLSDQIYASYGNSYRLIYGDFKFIEGATEPEMFREQFAKDKIRHDLINYFQFSSPAHVFFFYLNRIGYPCLKKDLCYRGMYSFTELFSNLTVTTDLEMNDIRNGFYRKGLLGNDTLKNQFLAMGGYI